MYEELGGGAVLPYRVLVLHPTINELLESCTSYRASVRFTAFAFQLPSHLLYHL